MKVTRVLAALMALLGLCGAVAQAPVVAQDNPKPTSGDPDAAFTSSIPFRYEGLIFVDVKVNGQGPYNFLFDSGADTTVLSSALAEALKIETVDSPMPAQGVGTAELKLAVIDSMRVAEFSRDEIVVGVMNFDAISAELGKPMDGILGQNMIKYMKKIVLDFPSSTLSITRYRAGKGPGIDLQEVALKMLLKLKDGMGGLPKIPGLPEIPGFPGDDDEDDPAPPRPEDDDEDQFSAKPAYSNWLAAETGATAFSYRHLDVLGGLMTVSMWFVDVNLNGKKKTLMFDTGASTLCVLASSEAKTLGLHRSFEYPVMGIGTSKASEGLLDKLEVGGFAVEETTCSIMDLEHLVEQLKMVGSDCCGIVGLPLALRFRRMTVDTETKQVTLDPYEAGQENSFDPAPSEAMLKSAVINTWQKKASRLGFAGGAIMLDERKKLNLPDGALRVSDVEPGAAAKAGLKKDDLVIAIVGVDKDDAGKAVDMPVSGLNGALVWACNQAPGRETTLRIRRGEETMELTYKLDAYDFKGEAPAKYR